MAVTINEVSRQMRTFQMFREKSEEVVVLACQQRGGAEIIEK